MPGVKLSEAGPAVIEEAPAPLRRIDSLINRAQGATAIVLASLAFGAGATAIESLGDISPAEAQTPATLLDHGAGKPRQVQEYAKIVLSNPGGEPLSQAQAKGFVIHEKCEEDSRPINSSVIYNKSGQSKPLGKCDIGSTVTVREVPVVKSDWLNLKPRKRTIPKATLKNNHSLFMEQEEGSASVPTTPAPGTAPAPAPGQPGQPGGGGSPPPENPYATGNIGVDISWAQCGTANETPSGADFGIVDVNNGLGYSTNPCLATEAADFPGKALNLYVNTAWNSSSSHINPNSPRACDTGDENCLAYNYGYNAGLYAYDAAAGLGIYSDTWWLDVESNATWSNDTTQNLNSLQGEHDALIASGATEVGAYSTTVQWGDITGAWLNDWPSWGATTWETAAEAQTYCTGHEFTGGPSDLMQYTPTPNLDQDVAC